MNIKVNVPILGKKAGEIVSQDDLHYKHFKSWAENKDRNGGSIICEFVEAEEKTIENGYQMEATPGDEITGEGEPEDSMVNSETTGDSAVTTPTDTVKDKSLGESTKQQSDVAPINSCACDVEGCDYVGKNEQAVRMHKVGKHR